MMCEAQWIIDLPEDVMPLWCDREAGHDGEHHARATISMSWS